MAKWWCLLAIENCMFRPIVAIIRFWQLSCYKSRRADGIFGYTIFRFFFFVMPPEIGGNIQKQQSVMWLLGFLQIIGTANGIAYLLSFSHCERFVAYLRQYMCGICISHKVSDILRPGFVLVADLVSEVQMISLFHYRGDGLSLSCKRHFTANVTKVICTINTVTRHHQCWINTAGIILRYLWCRSKRVWCAWWTDAIWRDILKSFNVFHFC